MQAFPRLASACALLVALAAGCASPPETDPRYRPAENATYSALQPRTMLDLIETVQNAKYSTFL